MNEKLCTSFMHSKEKQLDYVCLEQKLFVFITVSKICSNQGLYHLKEPINFLLRSIRVFFNVEVSFPFLWSFKVFAAIAKDSSTGGLLESQKSSPRG